MKNHYDERQLHIRRKGFEYTYVLTLVLIILLQIASFFLGAHFFSQLATTSILISLSLAFASAYFILNDAYYFLSEIGKVGWDSVCLIVFGIISIFFFWLDHRGQSLILQGQLNDRMLAKALQVFLIFVIAVCSNYKYWKNRHEKN